jgi:hypothetical protein
LQDLLKRLQDRLGECAQAVAKAQKAATECAQAVAKAEKTDSNVQTPSGRITCALEAAQHLRATLCRPHWSKQHMNMKINKVVVMYLDTGEISRPPAPPDVSAVKGIISSYSFLFFGTPGHYCMRKYSWKEDQFTVLPGQGTKERERR